jgi:hypothetical protein
VHQYIAERESRKRCPTRLYVVVQVAELPVALLLPRYGKVAWERYSLQDRFVARAAYKHSRLQVVNPLLCSVPQHAAHSLRAVLLLRPLYVVVSYDSDLIVLYYGLKLVDLATLIEVRLKCKVRVAVGVLLEDVEPTTDVHGTYVRVSACAEYKHLVARSA